MQFSGILVMVRPDRVADVAARLGSMAGIEVHARHDASGRLVVVQEAADVAAHEAGFRQIERLPGVIGASLVSHVADPEPGQA